MRLNFHPGHICDAPKERTVESATGSPSADFDYPSETGSMDSHDRLLELAAILATGIHRLRSIHSASPECTEYPAESPPSDLDQGQRLALMVVGLQPESEVSDDVH